MEAAKLENEVLAVVRSTGFERATFSVRSQPHVGGTTSSRGAVGTLTAASAIEQRDNERPLLTPIHGAIGRKPYRGSAEPWGSSCSGPPSIICFLSRPFRHLWK